MRNIIALFLFLLFLSCKSSDDNPSEVLIKDKNNEVYIAIFDSFMFMKKETFFHPTQGEIKLAEMLLVAELNKPKSQLVAEYHFFNEKETPLPLGEYKRQYYPIINKNKEKTLYFVGVCNKLLYLYPDWTTKEIHVAGGGNCFFRGEINLSTKKITHLSVNAPM